MGDKTVAYVRKSKDGRYPAHWQTGKSDQYDIFFSKFFEEEAEFIAEFHHPRRWIEDKNHSALFNYLGFSFEQKDSKIGISISHYFLLALYHEIQAIVGNSEKLVKIIKLLKKRLDFYKETGKRPLHYFEFHMRMARNLETNLFIYKDNLDFDSILEANNARFIGVYYDAETHIKISLSKIRSNLLQKSFTEIVKVTKLYVLDDKELELLLAIYEHSSNPNALEVAAIIEKGKFNRIGKKSKMTPKELANIHKLGEKKHFAEVSDLKLHHGKFIYGVLTEKISFDKAKYLSID